MQILLRRFLEHRGYSVKTAGSVGEAIATLERQSDERAMIARDAGRLFQKSGDLDPLGDHLDSVIH